MALIPLNTFKTKTAVLTTLNYNQAKCARDTGLIVDSLAFDLLFEGNTQSAYAGLQYWQQSGTTIPNETTQTIAALTYAATVMNEIITNTTVPVSVGNKLAQITNKSLTTDTNTITKVEDLITNIINIIQDGTNSTTIDGVPDVSVTNAIVPNLIVLIDPVYIMKRVF